MGLLLVKVPLPALAVESTIEIVGDHADHARSRRVKRDSSGAQVRSR